MNALRGFRSASLWAIGALITIASVASFAESYRGLYLWARHHSLAGVWAAAFPLQVDLFIGVGELALFVAMVDGWQLRQRAGAWVTALLGLVASVAGNVGHVAGTDVASRVTAAVPPLAAFAALWLGMTVLKRVTTASEPAHAVELPTLPAPVPADAEEAALHAYKASVLASSPLSQRQLSDRFGISRARVAKLVASAAAEANGHQALEAPADT